MVSFTSIVAGVLFAVSAAAQAPTANFTQANVSSILMPKGATTPSNPDSSTLVNWCKSQRQVCANLCGNSAPNMCDETKLTYTCTCPNGTTPPLQYYRDSIVGNECQVLLGNCLANGAQQPDAQAATKQCNQNFVCGNATLSDSAAAGSGSSASSTMATATASSTGAPATSSTAAAQHNAAGPGYGQYAPGMGAMMVLAGVVAAL